MDQPLARSPSPPPPPPARDLFPLICGLLVILTYSILWVLHAGQTG